MKIVGNLLKDDTDSFLVHTTALINETNSVVDRIMEDATVDSVVMANKDGIPILTNISVPNATRCAKNMQLLSEMVQIIGMEIDPLDDVLVFRIKTLKEEMIVATNKEFTITVVQRESRTKKKKTQKQPHIQKPRYASK